MPAHRAAPQPKRPAPHAGPFSIELIAARACWTSAGAAFFRSFGVTPRRWIGSASGSIRNGKTPLAPCSEALRSHAVKIEDGRMWLRLID